MKKETKIFSKDFKNNFKDIDKTLFFISLILIIFGSLNIVTASSREAVVNLDTSLYHFFYKHMIILFLSFLLFIVILNIPTKHYSKLAPFIYITVFCLNAYLILKGTATRGANNWINLKFMNFQPSEFSKPVLIVVLSLMFQANYKNLTNPNIKHMNTVWKIMALGLIIPILVFLQKDLGTSTILIGIFLVLFVFSPIQKQEKIKTIIASIIIILFLILVKKSFTGYVLTNAQTSRLNNFLNPCSKYEETGYQVCNAFIAINSGGITGVGLGKSTQKYSYIPEPHTDMVFAIISEENGILKCSLIFIAYLIILWRILKLSMKTKKLSSKYICLGVATYMFLHIFINLGGLFGLIPLTGVPLPFLSYGGSYTISFIIALSIVQRIHIEMKNEKIKL